MALVSVGSILAPRADHHDPHSTADLGPQTTSSPATQIIPLDSPITIGLFSGAGVILFVLIVWLIYALVKPRKLDQDLGSDEDLSRPPIPPEWFERPKHHRPRARLYGPIQHYKSKLYRAVARKDTTKAQPYVQALPSSALLSQSYAFIGPGATGSSTPSTQRQSSLLLPDLTEPPTRTLSHDEAKVLAHHTATKTIPRPFAPLQPEHARERSRSITSSRPSTAMSRPSTTSSQPSTSSFTRILSHVRAQPFSIGSTVDLRGRASMSSLSSSALSFASTPHRASTPRTTPPARIQPGAHVVHAPFLPVLPDEIEVAPGDHVTVVDSYDDGWCVVCRSSGEIQMGAVPAWVFDPSGVASSRTARFASLGVTVDAPAPPPPASSLDVEPTSPSSARTARQSDVSSASTARQSDMSSLSWSNF